MARPMPISTCAPPDEWTAREVAHHLATARRCRRSACAVSSSRTTRSSSVRRGRMGSVPALRPPDRTVGAVFGAVRASNAQLLDQLTDADWRVPHAQRQRRLRRRNMAPDLRIPRRDHAAQIRGALAAARSRRNPFGATAAPSVSFSTCVDTRTPNPAAASVRFRQLRFARVPFVCLFICIARRP